jgi:UDP-glucose 4-epimerase
MKYLVTGGGGFIGSHLASYLADQQHDVVVLDNFSTGKRENIKHPAIKLIEGDIRDFDCVSMAVAGVDTVFHQAALCSVPRSVADPISTHAVNTSGFLNVLEASRRAGVRRVVFASSSSVYGDSETLPKHELMPTNPLSPYAVSKLMGEHYCQLYWRLFGLETVALRYFNVFGPRQDPASEYAAVIPKFMQAIRQRTKIQIYGDGSQTRDFTYIDNVVSANVAAGRSPEAAGKVVNVACGDRFSLLELVNRLETILQCEVGLEFKDTRVGDVRHSQASIEGARRFIGYEPSVSFDDGLRKTVAQFFASGAEDLRIALPA